MIIRSFRYFHNMVANIKGTLDKNNQLILEQKEEMQLNRNLITNVHNICENIRSVSSETLNNVQLLSNEAEKLIEATQD